jgi:hypothetical protein
MSRYYVYAYFRANESLAADAGTPYYIGKGTGKRAFRKHSSTPTPKDKKNIVFLEQNLSEDEAHMLEIELIAKYGRKDLGTGILHNRTSGGEGFSGSIPWNKGLSGVQVAWNKGKSGYLSDVQRKDIGEAIRMRGQQTPEVIAKRAAAMMGKNKDKIRTEESKKAHSEKMKGRPSPLKGKASPLKGKPGRVWTEQQKADMSVVRIGKPWSDARRMACRNKKET